MNDREHESVDGPLQTTFVEEDPLARALRRSNQMVKESRELLERIHRSSDREKHTIDTTMHGTE